MFVCTACRRTGGTPLLLILSEEPVSVPALSDSRRSCMNLLCRLRHTDTDVPNDRQEKDSGTASDTFHLAMVYFNGSVCGQIMYTAFSDGIAGK
jgi:hypothetical protein